MAFDLKFNVKYHRSVQKSLAEFFLGEKEREVVDVQPYAAKWKARCARLQSNPLVGGQVKDDDGALFPGR